MPKIFADTRPLAQPDFRRLWQANIITVIGSQLTVVAVPAQIYAITESSGYVGLTGLFGLVPLIIFGLYGGTIADAFDKRKVLMVTTLGLILSTLGFFALSLLGNTNVWLLLACFSIQTSFFAVNQPTRGALTPRLIPVSQLAAANALGMTVMQFGAIVGPLLAGALIPLTGYTLLYAIDSVTMLATLWAVVKLPSFPPLPTTSGKGPVKPGLASVVDGFRYVSAQPILLIAFLADLIAMIFGMPRALFPELAHVGFGGPETGGIWLALLYSGMAAGAVAGGVFSGWVAHVSAHGKAVLWLIAAWGGAVMVAGAAAWASPGRVTYLAYLVVFMMVLGGMADMWSSSFRNAITQSVASDEVQGRIQSIHLIVVVGGPRIADMLHGYAANLWGVGPAFFFGGVGVVVGIGLCAIAVPSFRNYRVPVAVTEQSD